MDRAEALRSLPSVDRLVTLAIEARAILPRPVLVQLARALLDEARHEVLAGSLPPPLHSLVYRLSSAPAPLPTLLPVINATGVILQTNLGRAPLSQPALDALALAGAGYSNLEYDLEAGQRGSRSAHLREKLRQLTGAEDALVVNNNAAAVYLALTALALGREVLVSRSQAVEIGGGFRIPDVLRQSGATLVEVGTTNRTYARDYAAAISERSAAILRVHSSNFRIVGFVHEPQLSELAALADERGLVLIDDLGGGSLLDTRPFGLAPEPTVQESVAAGAGLVCFSGDKLLGGPQAGIIVGRAALIEQLRRHPLYRALRVDKLTIAALDATLSSYLRGAATEEIPVWQMIAAPVEKIRDRAEVLRWRLSEYEWFDREKQQLKQGIPAVAIPCESTVGGGSLPGATLPSYALALSAEHHQLDLLHAKLRMQSPAIIGRIHDQHLLFDLRTVMAHQDELILGALQQQERIAFKKRSNR